MASEPTIAKTTAISFTKLTIEALRQFLQQARASNGACAKTDAFVSLATTVQ